MILLPQPPECCDYRCKSSLVEICILTDPCPQPGSSACLTVKPTAVSGLWIKVPFLAWSCSSWQSHCHLFLVCLVLGIPLAGQWGSNNFSFRSWYDVNVRKQMISRRCRVQTLSASHHWLAHFLSHWLPHSKRFLWPPPIPTPCPEDTTCTWILF